LTVLLAGLGLSGPAAAQPGERYREAIPGTAATFEMIPVPGGSVEVPGPDGPRRVEVGPVWMSRTEVTWDAYDVFALGLDGDGTTPAADAVARPSRPYGAPGSGWGHAGHPAINITRAAADAYCEWLSAVTGRTYRLPTEAEWLHAASLATGGEPIPPERLDALAWHAGNAGGRTHPVASKDPDALGLHDLFGNVAEWVLTGDGRPVTRGGSFRDPPSAVAVAARAAQDPSWTERDPQLPRSRWWLTDAPFVGFRLVREP
jgi:formylglycine-generating enzyme required for sulfatase activity